MTSVCISFCLQQALHNNPGLCTKAKVSLLCSAAQPTLPTILGTDLPPASQEIHLSSFSPQPGYLYCLKVWGSDAQSSLLLGIKNHLWEQEDWSTHFSESLVTTQEHHAFIFKLDGQHVGHSIYILSLTPNIKMVSFASFSLLRKNICSS